MDRESRRRINLVMRTVIKMMTMSKKAGAILTKDKTQHNISMEQLKQIDSLEKLYNQGFFQDRSHYTSIFYDESSLDVPEKEDKTKEGKTKVIFLESEDKSVLKSEFEPVFDAVKMGYKDIVIISRVDITPSSRNYLATGVKGVQFRRFLDYQLAIFIPDHALAPQVKKVYQPNEMAKFRREEGLPDTKIPLLASNDKLALSFGLKPGSVVILELPGSITKTEIQYRKVVRTAATVKSK